MTARVTVRIDADLAAQVEKQAALDGVSLDRFVEAVLQRHIEFVGGADTMAICPDQMRADLTLRRDSDETDDEYEERRRLLLG